MRRILLSPTWWAGHVLVVLLAVLFCRLGWWQFDRSKTPTGSIQNFGYALQWPVFAAVLLYGWSRIVREEARNASGDRSTRPAPAPRRGAAGVPFGSESGAVAAARRRAEEAAAQDEELSAYNRYLADLAVRDGRQP